MLTRFLCREEMEVPHNKKQGHRGKARGVSLGPAENLKLRFPLLQLLYLPSFFLQEKVPSGKDSLNSGYFSKTFLELRLAYPIWRREV